MICSLKVKYKRISEEHKTETAIKKNQVDI